MGVWIALAGAVVSGLFSSRSEKKKAKADAKANEQNAKVTMWQDQYARKNEIEDREYKERGMGNYRSSYRGSTPLLSPAYSDPNSVTVVDPFAPKPRR